MKKFIFGLLTLILLALPSTTYAQASDICKNSSNLRFFPISINSITTTRLVDNTGSPNRHIVVCSITLTIIGAAAPQTLAFISGTGATCATGLSNLTGAMSGPGAATDTAFWAIGPFSMGKIKNGDSLCVVSSTVQQVSGVMTFVFVGPT